MTTTVVPGKKKAVWEVLLLVLIILVGILLRGVYLVEISEKPDFSHPLIDAAYHDYWARGLATGNWAR